MTNTCIADKPSTPLQKLQKAVYTNPFEYVSHVRHQHKENQVSVVCWHAIHDDPESYWTQLLLASVSSDYATQTRRSLWQEQEMTAHQLSHPT